MEASSWENDGTKWFDFVWSVEGKHSKCWWKGPKQLINMEVSLNEDIPNWMVYNGNFYVNGWFRSNPISRTPHMFFYIWLVVWIFVMFPYIGNTHPNWLLYISDRLRSTDMFGLRYVQACEVKKEALDDWSFRSPSHINDKSIHLHIHISNIYIHR